MSNLKVLISGSGVAGSVFAFWMLRAYPKANITIVERAPSLRLTGASVDIRDSAVDIIKWMGVEQEIRDCSTKEEGIRWVRANGTVAGTLPATGRTDVQSITSEYEIFRGELAHILIRPVLEHVKLIYNESVETFEQREDGVLVTFTRNKEVEKYDLVVAADGVGSRIRAAMLNVKPSEHVYDQNIHAAYFTIKRDLLEGSRLAQGYNAPGRRVVYLRPDPDVTGRTRACLIIVTTKADVDMKARLNAALRDGDESYMKLMEELFHDAGWILPEVLEGMRETDDFYSSLVVQVKPPTIQDSRVVLLGDAGYATPGFGTSLAMIGAYVLAGELLSQAGDVKTATKKYEELILPFVKKSQGGGGSLGMYAIQLLNPQTQWGISIMHTFIALITASGLPNLIMAIASAIGITGKNFPMPDYQWPPEGEGATVQVS